MHRTIASSVVRIALAGVVCASSAVFAQDQGTMTLDVARQKVVAARAEAFQHYHLPNAFAELSSVIRALQSNSADPAVRTVLADALCAKAEIEVPLGTEDRLAQAREDLLALLRLVPDYSVPASLTSLANKVKRELFRQVELRVTPEYAEVEIDGMSQKPGIFTLFTGEHALTANAVGHQRIVKNFTLKPDVTTETLECTLVQLLPVVTLVTSPPGVTVTSAGEVLGKTLPGPPPPDFAELLKAKEIPPAEASSPFRFSPKPGEKTIQFQLDLDCHVSEQYQVQVEEKKEYPIKPIRMERAEGEIVIDEPRGAALTVDGQAAGMLPFNRKACAGTHTIEVRSAAGSYEQTFELAAKQQMRIAPELHPTFAVFNHTFSADYAGDDPLALYARTLTTTHLAFRAERDETRVKSGWSGFTLRSPVLNFDAYGLPEKPEASNSPDSLAGLSERVGKAAGADGIAHLNYKSPGLVNVTLLARGSAVPDVLAVRLQDRRQVAEIHARLERFPATFWHPSLGLTLVDVEDVQGVLVEAVNTTSAADAGIVRGMVLQLVNGTSVTDAASATALLANLKAGTPVTLTLTDGKAAKTVTVPVQTMPTLFSLEDQSLMVNPLIARLRARAAVQPDAAVYLNLAAALIRGGIWAEALSALEKAVLPSGPGVSSGTVDYLRGICLQQLNRFEDARAAWAAAARDGASLLTEHGPPVKDLAERSLKLTATSGGRP